MKDVKSILIIKASALGDIVRAFPAIAYVREEFPDARISLMVGEEYVELVAPCPHVQEIIPYKKRRNTEDVAGFIRFAYGLRKRGFGLALNLQNTKRFDFLAKASGARRRSRIVEDDNPPDGVQGVFNILRTAGLEPGEPKYEFWLTGDDIKFADNFMRENNLENSRVLGLNPGVAWESKRWPLEHFAALADMAQGELGAKIIFFGNKAEADRAEKISSMMKTARPASAAGKTTIRQAAAIINRCSAFVSNDSGLMHISAMCGVPTVGVFGPTSPVQSGPCGPGHKTRYLALPCAPCYKHSCPIHTHDCLNEIRPSDVFEDVKGFFAQT